MSSPKNQASNPKKNNNLLLNNRPIYEDPRYKEFEGISLDKFKAEKEKSQREYIQLKKELEILKEEYEKTKIRTKERENELRGHINNLLIKYRTKDPELNIKNINELSGQILSNIKTLEEQTKIDIKEKKKDMETRIKLRLVDSEINYNKELEKKVKELIEKDKRYGRIVCRCETVTEGQVIEAIKRGARTITAVKMMTRAGTGRCQGGFCCPRVAEILSRELNIPLEEITRHGGASKLLTGKTKEVFRHE